MSTRTAPQSERALQATLFVQALQSDFVDRLESLGRAAGDGTSFEPTEWLRDGGQHGGGNRFGVQATTLFDRASINVSSVHYDDDPSKALGSATALSCIVHPRNPHAPSVHMHISWTELRNGRGYWRVMADLNPSISDPEQTATFQTPVEAAFGEWSTGAREQGERYFWIPALGRHRGASHFYLENHTTGDFDADLQFAGRVGATVIDSYLNVAGAGNALEVSATDREQQLEYHSLYLFQVLTLDRGTSSGLLVHDQNDVGILGSLPGHVNRELLASWRSKMPAPQTELLDAILDALPAEHPAPVTVSAKRDLAAAVRSHYTKFPEALALQASGKVLPPTVDNHR